MKEILIGHVCQTCGRFLPLREDLSLHRSFNHELRRVVEVWGSPPGFPEHAARAERLHGLPAGTITGGGE